ALMAKAFAMAVEAGRAAWRAGMAPEREAAEASSPLTGFLFNPSGTSPGQD
ncbi:MAG TPA: thiazole synthase, partial [Candidatus Hydrogenedentes bacterium]|nr:thiazole synthase [Candidatus Hydrogenedentota bacterium]